MSLDSAQSSSYVPSPHGAAQSSGHLAQSGDSGYESDNDIALNSADDWERFESLRRREFVHTRVYEMGLLEKVGMDTELRDVFHSIGWENLFEAPQPGSRFLTLEFLTTFESFLRGRKSMVSFRLFGKGFEFDLARFSELLDFCTSCSPTPSDLRYFNVAEFRDTIFGKSGRIHFSDIHNPTLRFLHR